MTPGPEVIKLFHAQHGECIIMTPGPEVIKLFHAQHS